MADNPTKGASRIYRGIRHSTFSENVMNHPLSPADQPFTKIYPRFPFPGFGSQGTCYVKVHVGDRSVTVLITQLKNYYGTSVTNAYEDIAPQVAAKIAEDLNIDHLRTPTPWWKLGAKKKVSPGEVMGMTKWLEHFPPGTGLRAEGTLAIMQLEPALNWHFCTRQVAQHHCDVPSEFFDINPADLDFKTA
jgi:hypothetical protein